MTQKPDGGPAYPHDVWIKGDSGIPTLAERDFGMSMRDYLAAHASEEDINAYQEWGYHGDAIDFAPKYTREQARYRYADAMIAARGNSD